MRKVKRFAAIVLTVALLSPTTAYAGNVEDAKALYEQVTEKQKSVTDMNAYYDYQIHLSGSALEGVEDLSNMRLEMNVRMRSNILWICHRWQNRSAVRQRCWLQDRRRKI